MIQIKECQKFSRLVLVLSGLAPLFILWAIKGSELIPNIWLASICLLLVLLPNGYLWLLIRHAVSEKQTKIFVVGRSEEHSDHLLIYLFTILVPLYSMSLDTWRDLSVALLSLFFIIFLFWHMRLQYMNIVFALFGYRIFSIYPGDGNNQFSGRKSVILITFRGYIFSGDEISTVRLNDTIYFEKRE